MLHETAAYVYWRVFKQLFPPKGRTRLPELAELVRQLHPVDCGYELIRVGAEKDGGYLIPNDLDGVRYCFSPGVSVVAEFEKQLTERGIHCFLADYSVDAPPTLLKDFTFDKKYLGSRDRDPFFTLATWKDKYLKDYSGDLMLQMDIEAFEYETILSTPGPLLDQFRIMVIEFHDLHRLFDYFSFVLISACFRKILEYFHVAHIHPNSQSWVARRGGIEIPAYMEITFLNKRRVTRTTPQTRFPHPLDAGNSRHLEQLPLPKCWYL
jgi:hypothetical protein